MSKRPYKAEPRFSEDHTSTGNPPWCVKNPSGKRIAITSGPNAERHAKQIANALTGPSPRGSKER